MVPPQFALLDLLGSLEYNIAPPYVHRYMYICTRLVSNAYLHGRLCPALSSTRGEALFLFGAIGFIVLFSRNPLKDVDLGVRGKLTFVIHMNP